MEKIKGLLVKYKELINYGFFGVLTTVVNFAAFYLLDTFLIKGEQAYLLNNAIAWFLAVVFAFITNKMFVFNSKTWAFKVLIKEAPEFFGGRIFSFAIEEAGLWLLVDKMNFARFSYTFSGIDITGEFIAKLVIGVVVVILNYFISKLIVFRNR